MSTVESYVKRVLEHVPRALPQRGRIELEIRAHLAESLEAGRSEAEAVNHMGPPVEVARSFLAEVELPPAGLGRRAAAFLIDMSLGLAFVVPAVLVWAAAGPGLGALGGLGAITWFPDPGAADEAMGALAVGILVVFVVGAALASFLYFPVLEHLYGQTLGKWLMGVAVVRENGLRVGFLPAVVRRLPLFFEFFWLDALFAPFTERKQRAFDIVAETLVVDVAGGGAGLSGTPTGLDRGAHGPRSQDTSRSSTR